MITGSSPGLGDHPELLEWQLRQMPQRLAQRRHVVREGHRVVLQKRTPPAPDGHFGESGRGDGFSVEFPDVIPAVVGVEPRRTVLDPIDLQHQLVAVRHVDELCRPELLADHALDRDPATPKSLSDCLLYTSDAADEEDSVDLGGRRIIKKKKKKKKLRTEDNYKSRIAK
eukprot:TRINITY_DN9842_c0_g1_i2.p1 TRINITY_DN9842_c0_g1~~TRINITY_DN9842_c0_g1_i2.p1  ORF type:complete len:170 (+),score=23.51 TRINITY_DN9842_c0_g1_i2:379-888(+)